MKKKDFNCFFENLKKDRSVFESFGFAFLQMTDRQLVTIIDWYLSEGLATKEMINGKEYYCFSCFKYPVLVYEDVKLVERIVKGGNRNA